MQKMQSERSRGVFYMVLCAVLWSTAGVFIKVLPWHPMIIAGFRGLISATFFYLYMRSQRIRFVFNRTVFWCGFFLMGTFFLFVNANKLTTAANAIVLQFSAPVFLLIFSSLIFKQKFRYGDVAAVAATTAGIALFFLDRLGGGYIQGNLVALIAGAFFAAMFLTTSRANQQERSSGILFGHLCAAAVGLPFWVVAPPPLNATTVSVILALGILQQGIPFVLYGMAIQRCSPLTCMLISAIEPLLNPAWVLLFYDERPGAFALVGGLIVIGSVVLWSVWSSRATQPETRPAAPPE